jgi:hypothetical protein
MMRFDASGLWGDDTGIQLNTKEPLDIPAELSGLIKITKMSSDDPLRPEEVSTRLGVEKFAVATIPDAAKGDPGSPPTSDCAREADPDPAVAFRDSGFTAGRGMRLVDAEPNHALVFDENVLTFESPSKAFDFIIKTQTKWLNCQHAVVDARNGNAVEKRTLGGASAIGDIDFLDDSIPDVPVSSCSHAIAAKSNVVVDVNVCGSRESAAAAPLAAQIRDKIPSNPEERPR